MSPQTNMLALLHEAAERIEDGHPPEHELEILVNEARTLGLFELKRGLEFQKENLTMSDGTPVSPSMPARALRGFASDGAKDILEARDALINKISGLPRKEFRERVILELTGFEATWLTPWGLERTKQEFIEPLAQRISDDEKIKALQITRELSKLGDFLEDAIHHLPETAESVEDEDTADEVIDPDALKQFQAEHGDTPTIAFAEAPTQQGPPPLDMSRAQKRPQLFEPTDLPEEDSDEHPAGLPTAVESTPEERRSTGKFFQAGDAMEEPIDPPSPEEDEESRMMERHRRLYVAAAIGTGVLLALLLVLGKKAWRSYRVHSLVESSNATEAPIYVYDSKEKDEPEVKAPQPAPEPEVVKDAPPATPTPPAEEATSATPANTPKAPETPEVQEESQEAPEPPSEPAAEPPSEEPAQAATSTGKKLPCTGPGVTFQEAQETVYAKFSSGVLWIVHGVNNKDGTCVLAKGSHAGEPVRASCFDGVEQSAEATDWCPQIERMF